MTCLKNLQTFYGKDKIILPAMIKEGKRGRVCAVKLKLNGTIMFDYTCNIQTFGYKSLECMILDVNNIWIFFF